MKRHYVCHCLDCLGRVTNIHGDIIVIAGRCIKLRAVERCVISQELRELDALALR